MNIPTKYFNLLFLFLLIGCTDKPEFEAMKSAGAEYLAVADEAITEEIQERKLIKEGTVGFETNDLSATRKMVLDAVDKYKGYVSSDSEYKSTGRVSNTLDIRVPSDKFDALLADATKGVEKFDSKEIQIKDVTEEFLDIEARLKTKKQLEFRYLELLKQAQNVTEILAIEKQIGSLRSDIESIEGRLNYLKDQVSFSTLSITFYQSVSTPSEFGRKFKDGFGNGWDNLIWFFVILTNLWPFILIVIALFIVRKIYRKRK